MSLLVSARTRRRASWLGAAGIAAAAAAAAVALLPSHAKTEPVLHLSGPGQVPVVAKEVPLTAARKHELNALLDVFVPAAVLRRHPLRALPLVTPAFRAGTSRDAWARGNLPVLPYHAAGSTFHGWTLDYSHPGEVSVDLLLHPPAKLKATVGALTFTVVFKRLHGRWLIDSFVPAASFAPERQVPRITAQPDFSPGAKLTPIDKPALSSRWLLVPASLLALAVLVPLGVVLAHWRKGRRALRAYQLSSR